MMNPEDLQYLRFLNRERVKLLARIDYLPDNEAKQTRRMIDYRTTQILDMLPLFIEALEETAR